MSAGLSMILALIVYYLILASLIVLAILSAFAIVDLFTWLGGFIVKVVKGIVNAKD